MSNIDTNALQSALDRTAEALRASPRAVLAIAALAAAASAHAQLAGDYERAGNNVGYELGRTVTNPRTQGIATAMGQILLGQVGRSADAQRRATEQAQAQAKADAAYMAAYDAERRKTNPNYVPGSEGYPALAKRGAGSTSQWNSVNGLSGIDAQLAALQRDWQQRNGHAQSNSSVTQTQRP